MFAQVGYDIYSDEDLLALDSAPESVAVAVAPPPGFLAQVQTTPFCAHRFEKSSYFFENSLNSLVCSLSGNKALESERRSVLVPVLPLLVVARRTARNRVN